MSSFGPLPLVFIGGNHQPFAQGLSQTTIGYQPQWRWGLWAATTGSGDLEVGRPWAGSVWPGLRSGGCLVGLHVMYMGKGLS